MPKVELIINGWVMRHPLGGIALHVRLLTEALLASDRAIEWRVAIPKPHRHLVSFIPEERLLLVDGASWVAGYVFAEIYWNQMISFYVIKHHPEAVFHSPFHYWAAFRPAHTVITVHDCIEQRSRPRVTLGRRAYRYLCWTAVRRATLVLTVSDWTRADLISIESVAPRKVVTVYNWVQPSLLRKVSPGEIARMREVYGIPERYIAYVGGFRGYKNIASLIRAWGHARKRAMIPPLALAGQVPPLKDDDDCRVHWALSQISPYDSEVLMPGVIADEHLAAFYAGASLFVSPSRMEGFGYPAVEAMASGVPLLVADATAFRELVDDPGMRFNPDDIEALAEKIHVALAEPSKFTKRLPEQFTSTNGAAKYIQVIKDIARRPRV